jgi:hypothetical protein
MALEGYVFRAGGLPPNPPVEAFINGQLCATGIFEPASYQLGGGDWYSALVIPPAEVVPGCGVPLAGIEIRVAGRVTEGGMVWRPGAFKHDIILAEPPSETAAIMAPESHKRRWFAGGFGIAVALAVIVGVAVVRVAGRKTPTPRH